jgi:hypothetical protein
MIDLRAAWSGLSGLSPDARVQYVTALETAGQQRLEFDDSVRQALEVESLSSCISGSGCDWALSTESVISCPDSPDSCDLSV